MNDNNNEDPLKREGHLELKLNKVSAFAHEKDGQRQMRKPVHVLGLPWKIVAISKEIPGVYDWHSGNYVNEQWLAFQLQCTGDNTDPSWTCAASVTFKVLAQKEGKQDKVREVGHHLFKASAKECGSEQFIQFETLMDPNSGWYDEVDDSVVLTVDFKADALRGISLIARQEVLLVNGKKVNVNKHHLACYSSYFERFFFGKEYKENAEIELELPATVEHFERMLDAMEPQNRPLDDGCIEGVYHLADRFLLAGVEERCRQFLYESSKHSAVFKYRLADKYDFHTLKKQILASPKENFFKEGDFFENVKEYAKLEEPACQALDTRFGQLFGQIVGTGSAKSG